MKEELRIRPTRFTRGVNMHAEGSCLVEAGNTRVLVTASVLEEVPEFLAGSGGGWVSAEYSMLPRATRERRSRLAYRGRPDGRALEIQRLIGRALRAAVETGYLAGRTVLVDCDVLQADGGTRTAAINGGMIALVEALLWMEERGLIGGIPLKRLVAAVSVGLVDGRLALDLDYENDASAAVDLNVVMGDDELLVEVQGTAEGEPVSREEFSRMLEVARGGIRQILDLQRQALGREVLERIGRP